MVRARRGGPGARRVLSMVGLVVATHGRLAEELLRTAGGIVGPLEQCEAVSVGAGASMEEARAHLGEAVKRVDRGDGVLVLTDIYGATPGNIALKLLEAGRVEGIAGVNLPMLMRALTYRERGMEILLTRAIAGGRDGVLNMQDH